VNSKIALVAQGIFELSDSIAYDCLWQFEKFRDMYPQNRVRVFAETLHKARYSEWPVEDLDRLWPWIEDDQDSTVIYHYCDGWPSFETRILQERLRLIVRWHNNTPPWFFAPYSTHPTARTTRGYQRILHLAEPPRTEFWVNSSFSARQLAFLGVPEKRVHVVYPASAYLSFAPRTQPILSSPPQRKSIRLLFVGRVTPHKGHKHLVAVSAVLQKATGQNVDLHLVGRADSSMQSYIDDVFSLARKLSVSVSMHGEIDNTTLRTLYEESDVFLALSEHEGFGLPLFEAMRLAIPVVALRSTAIRDLFYGHPLGVDALDYREIALRVIAALDPGIRESIIAWQTDQLVTCYNNEIVANQLSDGIARQTHRPTPQLAPSATPIHKSLEGLRLALWSRIDNAASALSALQVLPRDTSDRFVTRYDIAAYSALLASHGTSTSFYDAALAQRFTSNRRLLGPPLRFARQMALSIQSGLVNAMGMLDANVSAQLGRMESRLSRMESSLETMQKARATPAADQPTVLAAGRTFGDSARLYGRDYFEGDGKYSNYVSYTRDAAAPCRELARTLFDLFQPVSALEAGCAVGFAVKALRELHVAAVGCDISEWAVREAGSPFIVRFDISRESIPGKFDLVFAYNVLENIPLDDVKFTVRNLWNASNRYLVIAPRIYSSGDANEPNEPTHCIFRDHKWWRSLIETTCETALDPVATGALDRSEHSMKYNYSGKIMVVSRH
jgi:glycosyltransferase involved in cell wall biosynthesis